MLSIPPISTTGMARRPTIPDPAERAPKLEIMIPATAMQTALTDQMISRINRASMPKAMALAWSSETARMASPQRVRKRKRMMRAKVTRDKIPAQIGSDKNRKFPASRVMSGRCRKKE